MIRRTVSTLSRFCLAVAGASLLSHAALAGDSIKDGMNPAPVAASEAESENGRVETPKVPFAKAALKPVTADSASRTSLHGYFAAGDRLLESARLVTGNDQDITLPQLARATVQDAPASGLVRMAAWRRFAIPYDLKPDRPKIVIVMDDLGLNRPETRRLIDFDVPLTLSFLPYAPDLPEQTRLARAKGHELLVHMPMEPLGRQDPGPNALKTSLSQDEIHRRLVWALSRFNGYVGINNHMGSKFTQFAPGLHTVMATLHARGLMFLDSRTGPSIARGQAAAAHVPFLKRDVFIDHYMDEASVKVYLKRLEEEAAKHGYAIGIGHPHPVTVRLLESWVKDVQARGFQIVPLTAVMKENEAPHLNAQAPAPSGVL